LSLVVLASFAAGAAIGLTAALSTLARQWRERGQMRARLKRDEAEKA
jgi:hypothetical protein